MNYGEKITTLRKSKGMTQAELGTELNVTSQAVSKWERSESYPDFETLSKIARIFGVPINYFEDGVPANEYATAATTTAAAVPAQPTLLGVCTKCGRSVFNKADIAQESPLVCTDCRDRKIAMAKTLQQEAQVKAQIKERNDKASAKHLRNKGLVTGGVVCGILLLFVIVGLILEPTDIGDTILGYFIVLFFLFPFVSQLYWRGIVATVAKSGFHIIGTPGVIFTLDFDGLIFLMLAQLLFAVLKFVVLIFLMALFGLAAMIISPFTFVPACIKLSRGILPDEGV